MKSRRFHPLSVRDGAYGGPHTPLTMWVKTLLGGEVKARFSPIQTLTIKKKKAKKGDKRKDEQNKTTEKESEKEAVLGSPHPITP